MNVSSIGPFAAIPSLDDLDLDRVEEELSENLKATSPVSKDAAAGDSTDDQENRGFIHLADFLDELNKPKVRSRRSHDVMFSNEKKAERVILKYLELDLAGEAEDDKGRMLSKAA